MRGDLSPREAAERIGATTRSVQRWIASGMLPARRVGGRWRVASDALDAFERGAADGRLAREAHTPARVPIRILFVANRGEIAARVRRSAERLGIRTIVAGEIGPGSLDLLDGAAVVTAARSAGADALHPGYGFLAESAAFAAAVEAAGIRWVGPPAPAITAMGDKAAARRLAANLGIPTPVGYDDADQSDAAIAAAAAGIGPPLLIKPAAGGGGKGMRAVYDLAELPESVAAAKREAQAAFGDSRVILERLLEGSRHVEIQVMFDAHGAGVHLGERDCSLQRRHQKVLEETPSPGLDRQTREGIAGAALRLAGAVGYRNAGTCEFLVSDRGEYVFLEMNTRLQVEHPVTEAVSGRDLVADQLAIAEGASLADIGLVQEASDLAIAAGGHAVEVRLYAEDPDDGFLPATGRVAALRWPTGDGIRVDAGVEAGTDVGARFDPLLAKVVVHGRDRGEALARLARALDRTLMLGLTTNLRFLRWLVAHPAVVAGRARTDTLERIWPPADLDLLTAVPDEAWSAAAAILIEPVARQADGAGPQAGATNAGTAAAGAAVDSFVGGWRLNGPPLVRVASDGTERRVNAIPRQGDAARDDQIVHLDIGGRSVAFALAPPPDVERAARAAAHSGQSGVAEILAPMPGSVIAIHVGPGDQVERGDPLVTLEAMKMEHVVSAPGPGRVGEVLVEAGDQVTRRQRLATVEPAALP